MVAEQTLTHMAATSNWTISALRDATLSLMDRKNWTTNRLASEVAMMQSTVEKFLSGGAPSPRLRELLVTLMARQGIEPPDDTPVRPRSMIAYFAEQPDKPEPVSEPEPEPDDIELVGIFNPAPFPMGFAVIWNTQPIQEPALRVSKTGILLNRALRDALESPESVLLAIAHDGSTFRLAVALPTERLQPMAIRVPQSGELAQRVRTLHIGPVVPDGTYPVERDGNCWVTAAHPIATNAN